MSVLEVVILAVLVGVLLLEDDGVGETLGVRDTEEVTESDCVREIEAENVLDTEGAEDDEGEGEYVFDTVFDGETTGVMEIDSEIDFVKLALDENVGV